MYLYTATTAHIIPEIKSLATTNCFWGIKDIHATKKPFHHKTKTKNTVDHVISYHF